MPGSQELAKRIDALKGAGLPQHVAIIMDGNRRWALERSLPIAEGHRAGAEAVERLIRFVGESLPIRYLTLYAFSSENWSRAEAEIGYLMSLFEYYLTEKIGEFIEKGVLLQFIGDTSQLPLGVREAAQRAADSTSKGTRLTVSVAMNYGGRDEIVRAARKLAGDVAANAISPDDIDEDRLAASMYLGGIEDPELIIRTSGEQRLSNFLLWQCAYSELIFTEIYWPDFDPSALLKALGEYQRRSRRFGGDSEGPAAKHLDAASG